MALMRRPTTRRCDSESMFRNWAAFRHSVWSQQTSGTQSFTDFTSCSTLQRGVPTFFRNQIFVDFGHPFNHATRHNTVQVTTFFRVRSSHLLVALFHFCSKILVYCFCPHNCGRIFKTKVIFMHDYFLTTDGK